MYFIYINIYNKVIVNKYSLNNLTVGLARTGAIALY